MVYQSLQETARPAGFVVEAPSRTNHYLTTTAPTTPHAPSTHSIKPEASVLQVGKFNFLFDIFFIVTGQLF